MTTLAEFADLNLAATWSALGQLGGASARVDHVHLYATGLPVPAFNGAIVTGRSADPGGTLDAVFGFMAGRGVPWVLWARPGVDDGLVAAARAAGLGEQPGPPAMGFEPIPDPPPLPAGVEVEVAEDHAGLEIHRDLLVRAFGMPPDLVAGLVTDRFVDFDPLTIVIGRVDGIPVSTALVTMSGDTAGIYNVATPPEYQRRGFGTALTWATVDEGVRRGAVRSILQASPAGLPVYERMGYVQLGTYLNLVGEPS